MVEAVQMVVDGLEDGTIGVNQQIPSVPLRPGDPAPPEIDKVYNIYDEPEIAAGGLGDAHVQLIVTPDTPTEWEGEIRQVFRDGSGTAVSIRYATYEEDLAEAVRNGYYTLRAIRMWLKEFMDDANAGTLRELNGIHLQTALGIIDGTFGRERGQGVVAGASVVTFGVRDTQP